MWMVVDLDLEAPAILRAISEPVRWRILTALAREELCVCHLSEDLDLPQPLVSHHVRVLREAGVVEGEKWRYWTYYRLRPEALKALSADLRHLATGCPARGNQRRPCC